MPLFSGWPRRLSRRQPLTGLAGRQPPDGRAGRTGRASGPPSAGRAGRYAASARLIDEVIAFMVASMVEGSMPMPQAWEPLISANT
ncbi:hypothetical protein COFR110785_04960 [Corynebacterium frankenforstense]